MMTELGDRNNEMGQSLAICPAYNPIAIVAQLASQCSGPVIVEMTRLDPSS